MAEKNQEARVLLANQIAALEDEVADVERDRAAAWRKHTRLGQRKGAIEAEIEELKAALTVLGGPIPTLTDDELDFEGR